MGWVPAAGRYEAMPYRRCGRSGLLLPAISLGLWHNFGEERPLSVARKILLRAFDLGITHFDRADPETPVEETMGALDAAVRQGKALYAGISSYGPKRTAEAVRILRELGTPLLIHQPSYSMLNRWIEEDLLDVIGREGVGSIVFSPLAQGMLTDKYLDGIPEGSRASQGRFLTEDMLSDDALAHVRALNEIARGRG